MIGERLLDALHQTVSGRTRRKEKTRQLDAYIIVQRGTKIAFFEFHSNSNDVEETTHSIQGCTSLTQPLTLDGKEHVIMPNLPNNLELLTFDKTELFFPRDFQLEADRYTIPCVFDLEKHEKEIYFLFDYMSKHKPRGGPDREDFEQKDYKEDFQV